MLIADCKAFRKLDWFPLAYEKSEKNKNIKKQRCAGIARQKAKLYNHVMNLLPLADEIWMDGWMFRLYTLETSAAKTRPNDMTKVSH